MLTSKKLLNSRPKKRYHFKIKTQVKIENAEKIRKLEVIESKTHRFWVSISPLLRIRLLKR